MFTSLSISEKKLKNKEKPFPKGKGFSKYSIIVIIEERLVVVGLLELT